ncbi:hypothetical protein Bca52824_042368 [Brassica carinata]|uniref:Uncharacterized protein n=1 Tax=Brassica carinata TaxID=52824 RepID=A0A8X7RV43_BRACI|nr:hypothetical protein Bca52824_042368 [Brassica carinata]
MMMNPTRDKMVTCRLVNLLLSSTILDDLTLKIWEPDISMMHSGEGYALGETIMAYMVDYISVQLVLTEWLEFAGLIFVHTLVIMTVPYTQLTGLGINISLGFLKAWFTMKAAGPSYNLLLKKEKTHDMDVNSVQWSPCEENRLLASVSDDGMVKIWQLATKP